MQRPIKSCAREGRTNKNASGRFQRGDIQGGVQKAPCYLHWGHRILKHLMVKSVHHIIPLHAVCTFVPNQQLIPSLREQHNNVWNLCEAGKHEVWRGEITSATFVIQGHSGSFYYAHKAALPCNEVLKKGKGREERRVSKWTSPSLL